MDVFRICCFFCLILDRTVFGLQLVSKGKFITSIGIFNDQSSWTPDKAIDGDAGRNPDTCKCCAATRNTLEPWYSLDLGQSYAIRRINVLGRETNHNLENMEIAVGNTRSDVRVLTKNTNASFEFDYRLPQPESGRFVRLTLRNTKNVFVICELYVYAECSFGRYGEKCTGVCGQCYRNFPCDPVSGDCSACARGYKPHKKCTDECDDGHYGWHCIGKCGNCYNNEACDKVSGRCKKCAAGYNGTMCIEECVNGTYGRGCVRQCGKCLNNEVCEKADGTCKACAAVYSGRRCRQKCGAGRYGLNCTERCGNCSKGDQCNHINGSCPNGCASRYQGELCKNMCPGGFYGDGCKSRCGACYNKRNCDSITGHCLEGCEPGFNGSLCVDICPAGYYGANCASACGECSGPACQIDTGVCPEGCIPGYSDKQCKVECEEGTYGEGCTSICGNCHGNEICNKQNGTCQACECGYTGHDCKGEINSAASRGECPTCNIAMIVGGTLVSILAIEGVAAALFLLIRKRRRSLKNGTMNRSNTYELPNRGINEGEHEYESAIELDVNTNAFENTGHQAT